MEFELRGGECGELFFIPLFLCCLFAAAAVAGAGTSSLLNLWLIGDGGGRK